jgi:hypothetical protein
MEGIKAGRARGAGMAAVAREKQSRGMAGD